MKKTAQNLSRQQIAYIAARAEFDVAYEAYRSHGKQCDAECVRLGISKPDEPYGILPEGHPMAIQAQSLLDVETAARERMYQAARNLIDWAIGATLARCGTETQKSDIIAMAEKVKKMAFVERPWVELVDLSLRLAA